MVRGVSLREFHYWVARKVQSADPNNFTPPSFVCFCAGLGDLGPPVSELLQVLLLHTVQYS